MLKEYTNSALESERMQLVCDAQEIARQQGLPVPRVVRTKDGRSFTQRNGVFFSLSEHIEGRIFPPGQMPKRAAARMGEVLAPLHRALQNLPEGTSTTVPSPDWIEEHLLSLLAIGDGRRAHNALDEVACTVLEQKLRLLKELTVPAPYISQWTHGDYEWRNVLFNNRDEVVGIIDFDDLLFGNASRDITRCVVLSFPAGSEEAIAFFEGYASSSQVTSAEAHDYVTFYRYTSTFKTWPMSVRYLEPEKYFSRWDEFLQPLPEWDWEQLAHSFADIAARTRVRDVGGRF